MTEPEGGLDERQARIVAAAMALFMERGYAGTSTLAIATRARVSKRDLYAAFADKRAILAACIRGRSREFAAPPDLPAPTDRAGLSALLLAYGRGLRQGLADPEVIAAYRLAVQEAGESIEVARTLHEEGREAATVAITALLAASRARGLLGPEAPATVAGVYLSLLVGDMVLQHLLGMAPPETPAESEAHARLATETVLRLYGAG